MDPWFWWVATAVLAFVWLGPGWRPRGLAGVDRPGPWAFGHRGVRGSLPENTMAAFRAALDAGLDGLETDVQRTRDGHLVLFHDFEVAGRRLVDTDLAALRAVVPDLATLDELLALVAERPGTVCNVELKTRGWGDRALARSVARALRASGLADRLVVSSFSPLALARLRVRAPELRTAFLWSDHEAIPRVLWGPWPGALLHVDALHPHHRLATPERVAAWRRRGLRVHVWTVNEADDVARVLAAGVDGVMADDPAALLAAMGRTP